MANIPLLNRISCSEAGANIDANYGPYVDLESAYTALSNRRIIAEGYTVGIIEDDKIVEYWFQGGTALENLVRKTSTSIVDLKEITGSTLPDSCKRCVFTWGENPAYTTPCLYNGSNCTLIYVYALDNNNIVNRAYVVAGQTIITIFTGDNIPMWVQALLPSYISERVNELDERTKWK